MSAVHPDPLRYACGYSLDVYCKYMHQGGGIGDDSYFGRTFADCARQAKAAGWLIHADDTCTCPSHNPKHKASKP